MVPENKIFKFRQYYFAVSLFCPLLKAKVRLVFCSIKKFPKNVLILIEIGSVSDSEVNGERLKSLKISGYTDRRSDRKQAFSLGLLLQQV